MCIMYHVSVEWTLNVFTSNMSGNVGMNTPVASDNEFKARTQWNLSG